jgi:hypothetical protein
MCAELSLLQQLCMVLQDRHGPDRKRLRFGVIPLGGFEPPLMCRSVHQSAADGLPLTVVKDILNEGL